MTLFMTTQSAVLVRLDFWKYAGEIYPNLSGNDPNGDHKGINGTSKDTTDANIYPAPGKGIYNDNSYRYVHVDG